MNRTLWIGPFDQDSLPPWPCPSCGAGTLELVKDTLQCWETKKSRLAHGHEAWDPDWITERFVALLRCSRSGCGDAVIVSGDTVHEMEGLDHSGQGPEWSRRLTPKYFHPALPLVPLPKEAPESVSDQLASAFALVWSSPAAAANRIRAGLEALLTEQGVKQYESRTGKRKWLTLHARLELFTKANPELADRLMAAKWLGNEASHGDTLSAEDVFDALDLVSDAIDQLYVKHQARLAAISKRINERRGPRTRSRHRRL